MLLTGLMLFIIIVFVQPQEFIVSIKGLAIVDIVMVFVIAGWLLKSLATQNKRYVKAHQNILMILFWGIIVMSTLNVAWPTYTINIILEWGKYIIIYFLMVNIIDTPRKLKKIIWTVVLSSMVVAGLGILQHYGIDYTGVGIREEGRIRGIGIFDTNQLAYVLANISPFAVGLIFLTRNLFLKLNLLIILSGFYYAIYLTGSRGGLLCAAASSALIFVIFSRKFFFKALGVVAAVMIFIFFMEVAPRMSTISSYQRDSSAMDRLDVWGEALMTLKDYPIVGIGKNQFSKNFPRSAHSSYIQTVSELGLIGLFLWLALFYFSLKNLKAIDKNSENSDKSQKIMAKSFRLCLYSYLIGSIFSGNAYYLTLYIIFALVVIFQSTSNMEVFKKRPVFTLKDIRNIGIYEMAIILFIHWLC
jgi:O-antigen ligase